MTRIAGVGLALTYDSSTRTTTALVALSANWVCPREPLSSQLQLCPEAIGDPLLFFLLLTENLVHHYFLSVRERNRKDLMELQRHLDLVAVESEVPVTEQADNLKIIRIMRELTKLQTRLAMVKRDCNELGQNKTQSMSLHQWYLDRLQTTDYDQALPLWKEIQQRLEWMYLYAEKLDAELSLLRSDAQATVQTVCQLSSLPMQGCQTKARSHLSSCTRFTV